MIFIKVLTNCRFKRGRTRFLRRGIGGSAPEQRRSRCEAREVKEVKGEPRCEYLIPFRNLTALLLFTEVYNENGEMTRSNTALEGKVALDILVILLSLPHLFTHECLSFFRKVCHIHFFLKSMCGPMNRQKGFR